MAPANTDAQQTRQSLCARVCSAFKKNMSRCCDKCYSVAAAAYFPLPLAERAPPLQPGRLAAKRALLAPCHSPAPPSLLLLGLALATDARPPHPL